MDGEASKAGVFVRGGVEIEVLTNGGNFSDYPLVREDPVTKIAL
jgi:hypothetical protein